MWCATASETSRGRKLVEGLASPGSGARVGEWRGADAGMSAWITTGAALLTPTARNARGLQCYSSHSVGLELDGTQLYLRGVRVDWCCRV